MRHLLGRFQAELEALRRSLVPTLNGLRARDPAKTVVDLGRRKTLVVERQHFARRQILRIKGAFPLRILKARCAYPVVHGSIFIPRYCAVEKEKLKDLRVTIFSSASRIAA